MLVSYGLENWCPFWCPFGPLNSLNRYCTRSWNWRRGSESSINRSISEPKMPNSIGLSSTILPLFLTIRSLYSVSHFVSHWNRSRGAHRAQRRPSPRRGKCRNCWSGHFHFLAVPIHRQKRTACADQRTAFGPIRDLFRRRFAGGRGIRQWESQKTNDGLTPAAIDALLNEEIPKEAYKIWLAEHCRHGDDLRPWLHLVCHSQFLISGKSSPCSQMYFLWSISLFRINCLA